MLLLRWRGLLVEDCVLEGEYEYEGEQEPVTAGVGCFPVALGWTLQTSLHGEADRAADLGLI